YFNQELYGKPTSLPWELEIAPAHRMASYTHYATFQPSFLYELIFDLALAAALVWLDHHQNIRPPDLLALYVTDYSGSSRKHQDRSPRAFPGAAPHPFHRDGGAPGGPGRVHRQSARKAAQAARRHRTG